MIQDRLRKMLRQMASAWLLALVMAGTHAAQPYAPTTGTLNNLVVFVRFSDQPEFTRPVSYYDNLFNSASTSLKNFYLENSYNSLTVSSTFYPASGGNIVSYQDTHPSSYYRPYDAAANPNGYRGAESTTRETALVTNALNAISAQISAGLNLDGNNDGYIDHIVFEVYSTNLNPLPVLFYSRATYDTSGSIVINGKRVGNYTWVSAPQDTQPAYPGATEIHEMGHSFGYPDLRDNSGRTPVGDWDVMSLSRPVHSGAYMKYRFTRWIPSIPEITSYGTYTLNDITQATNNSYKIAIPNSSEYLVLEYRKAAGPFESSLPGSGLCVTRVNEAAGIWGNMDGPPYFLYYYRADGSLTNDGSGNAWVACLNSESGRTQFNDRSNPACFLSDGSACGISIYGVGSTSGSSLTFSVGDPNAAVLTHAISGYLSSGGSRVSGASVTLSGDASSVATTGSLGTYAFAVAEHGTYTITPTKANLTFSPLSRTYADNTTDQSQNFSATNNTTTISGTITSAGTPLSGVTVYCTGGNYPAPVTTDATGAYSFTVYAGSDYQVWPAKTGYFFSPNSKTLTNATTNLVQDFNTISSSSTTLASSLNPASSGQSVTFTASINGYAPSGSVNFNDSGIAVCSAVAVSNGQARCTADSLNAGNHSITAAYSGDGANYASSSAALAQVVTAAASTTTTTTTTAATTTTTAPITTTSTTTTVPTTTTTTVTSQPLFTVGDAVVTSDSASAAVSSSLDAATGNIKVIVTSGRVNLLAASAAGGKIYAGEVVQLNSAGVVSAVTLGSASGKGSAGDPLVVADKPPNLDIGNVVIPALKGTVARLDGGTLSLEQAILAAAPGIALGAGGQTASGALPLTSGKATTSTTYLQPLGAVTIDTTRADGTTINDDGMIQLVKNGVAVTFAPGVPDTRQFAAALGGAVSGASVRLSANGTMVAGLGGNNLVLQPGLVVTPGAAPGPAGFEQDGKGYIVYRDSNGNRQTLYPAFLDIPALTRVLKANLGANATIRADFAGSASVSIGGVPAFTLNPDYNLSSLPAAQDGKSWWADPAVGKFFVVNSDGSVQGFTAK